MEVSQAYSSTQLLQSEEYYFLQYSFVFQEAAFCQLYATLMIAFLYLLCQSFK